MSDKSNKYGYVGADIPAQSFGANKGVFNPAEINELVADNKWTSFGQLELIETQTVSSTVEYIIFDDIKQDIYNVHFMTINNLGKSANGSTLLTVSNDNGTTFETANGDYQYAIQRTQTNGSFAEEKSTNPTSIRLTNTVSTGTGETANLYCYMYNLGDSTKYSFFTYHTGYGINATFAFGLGSAVYPTAETINAFRIQTSTANIIETADVSLYGIRYS